MWLKCLKMCGMTAACDSARSKYAAKLLGSNEERKAADFMNC
jgi:hypothetical protein